LVERFSTGIDGLDLLIGRSYPSRGLIHVAGGLMEEKGLKEKVPMASGRLEDSKKVSDKFDSAVQEAVHEGLLVLGEIVRNAIYQHIEMKHQLKRWEIPKRLQVFHKALEGIFGAGAKIVEKLIVKRLHGKLGLSFVEHESWTLGEYVDDAKKRMGGS